MNTLHFRSRIVLMAIILTLLSLGCRVEKVVEPKRGGIEAVDRVANLQDQEEELLGSVYDGSVLSDDTTLYFHLVPRDSATAARLAVTNFDSTVWVDPSDTDYSFGYYTPAAGSKCGGSYAECPRRTTRGTTSSSIST